MIFSLLHYFLITSRYFPLYKGLQLKKGVLLEHKTAAGTMFIKCITIYIPTVSAIFFRCGQFKFPQYLKSAFILEEPTGISSFSNKYTVSPFIKTFIATRFIKETFGI